MRRVMTLMAGVIVLVLGAPTSLAATPASSAPPGEAKPPKALLLARSTKDFSGTQGAKGWTYGYYASPPTPTFTPMTQYSPTASGACAASTWYVDCSQYWTQIGKSTMHPQSTTTSGGRTPVVQWPVRRWTSTYTGIVHVRGKVAKVSAACGDDTEARVLFDGVEQFSGITGDTAGFGFDIRIPIQAGEKIDFALDPLDNDLCDLTRFTVVIVAE